MAKIGGVKELRSGNTYTSNETSGRAKCRTFAFRFFLFIINGRCAPTIRIHFGFFADLFQSV